MEQVRKLGRQGVFRAGGRVNPLSAGRGQGARAKLWKLRGRAERRGKLGIQGAAAEDTVEWGS